MSALSIIYWISDSSIPNYSYFTTLRRFLAEMQPIFSSSNSLKILEVPALVLGACAKAVKAVRKELKSTILLELVI